MTYSCIMLDPPWAERGGGGRGADKHYDVIEDRGGILRVIHVSDRWRPADNCHVWCWTTMMSLLDGLWLLDALGARYVTHAVWCKVAANQTLLGSAEPTPLLGIGQYLRGAHEILLLGVIGDGYAVRTEARNIPSWFVAPAPRDDDGQRIHSRKPQRAYEIIETRSRGPRLEMFARTARPGWDAWGNEAPTTTEEP